MTAPLGPTLAAVALLFLEPLGVCAACIAEAQASLDGGSTAAGIAGYADCLSTNCYDFTADELVALTGNSVAASVPPCNDTVMADVACDALIKDITISGFALSLFLPAAMHEMPWKRFCVAHCSSCAGSGPSTPAPMSALTGAPTPAPPLEPTPAPTPAPVADQGNTTGGDGVCIDDSEWLVDGLVLAMPALGGMREEFSCSWIVAATFDLHGQRGQILRALYTSLGITGVLTCQSHLAEMFSQSHLDIDTSLVNARLDEICCHSCSIGNQSGNGTNSSSSSANWTLSGLDASEAEAALLYAFFQHLGVPVSADAVVQKDWCSYDFVICRDDYYNVELTPFTLGISKLNGTVSADIAELRLLRMLWIVDLGVEGKIPPEIANTAITVLVLRNNRLSGPLPDSMALMTGLDILHVSGNHLTGSLRSSFFQHWTTIRQIDLSRNAFEGTLPDVDFSIQRRLSQLRIAGNNFSKIGAMSMPDDLTDLEVVEFDFSYNKLVAFPPALRWLRHMAKLDLSYNEIHGLPVWGFPNAQLAAFMTAEVPTPGEPHKCFWDLAPEYNDFRGALWSSLRFADLTGNPLNVTLHHLTAVFGNAPLLTVLICQSCSLTGTVVKRVDTTHYLYKMKNPVDEDRQCTAGEAYSAATTFDVSSNPGIEDCDYVSVRATASTDEWMPLECGSCPARMRVPPQFLTPLRSFTECECMPSLQQAYDTESKSAVCACEPGTRFDHDKQACVTCLGELDCSWADWKASLMLPPLRPGNWIPCLSDASEFLPDLVYKCYSSQICFGGVRAGSGCSDEEFCAEGRMGRACGQCIPGHYGGPDGPCMPCGVSPETARLRLSIALIVMVPALLVLSQLLGQDTSIGNPVEDYKTAGKVKRFYMDHKGDFTKMSLMIMLIVKWIQVLAVVAEVNVAWTGGSKTTMEGMQVISFRPDAWTQTGCMLEAPSVGWNMAWQWTLPFILFVLTGVAALLGWLLNSAFARLVGKVVFTVTPVMFSTFLYKFWNCFFAVLVRKSLLVFICKEHPSGERTITRFPESDCYVGDWGLLALGGSASFIIYVCTFIVASYLASQRVAATLKSQGIRGDFAFTTYGLRISFLHWNTIVAVRDVMLNAVLAIFAGDRVVQVLSLVVIFLYYAHTVHVHKPYQVKELNRMDAWFPFWIAMFLISVGLQGDRMDTLSPTDAVDGLHNMMMFLILLCTICVPVLILVLGVVTLSPQVVERMPERIRPETDDFLWSRLTHLVDEVDHLELCRAMSTMDVEEWRRFLTLVYGTRRLYVPCGEAAKPVGLRKVLGTGLGDVDLAKPRSRSAAMDAEVARMDSVDTTGSRAYSRRSSLGNEPPVAQQSDEEAICSLSTREEIV